MTDHVAIVTGGAGALGRAVVRRLADSGYRIAVVGLRTPPLEAIAAGVAPDRGAGFQADLGTPEGAEMVVTKTLARVIDTPANRQAIPGSDPDRWVKPERLAEVIRFLCSPESAEITGAAIPVYGRT